MSPVLPQLLDMLSFYSRFEISDQTGDPLSDRDMMQLHYSRITSLQVSNYTLRLSPRWWSEPWAEGIYESPL